MLQCGICHESEVDHIGLLDTGCNHCFHYDCIVEWSKRQTWCPFCKRTFTSITHKALDAQQLPTDPPDGLIDLAALPGTLVGEPLVVEQKTQDDLLQFLLQEDTVEGSLWAHARGEEEQEEEDEYATLVCDVCNQGNDEALMLLCDECDQGFHTYCVGLQHIPQGNWYCDYCQELRHVRQERVRQTSTHRQPRSHRPHTRSRGNDGLITLRTSLEDDVVDFIRLQVEQAINRSTSRAQRAAARAPERRRIAAIQDNWEDLRQGTATFQQPLEPHPCTPPPASSTEPAATPPSRLQRGRRDTGNGRAGSGRMTRRRLQRQIRVAAARAARARSVRSGRPPPPVSDPAQQAARARAAALLRLQRQQQGGGGGEQHRLAAQGLASGSSTVRQQQQGQAVGTKRVRDSDSEDEDVPLAQRRMQHLASPPSQTTSTVPRPQPGPSQRLQQLYNRMGIRAPVQDERDARLAALARGQAPQPRNP